MIRSLRIKDIAIIEELDVEFCLGLNIITGETGAGKSLWEIFIYVLFKVVIESDVLVNRISKEINYPFLMAYSYFYKLLV